MYTSYAAQRGVQVLLPGPPHSAQVELELEAGVSLVVLHPVMKAAQVNQAFGNVRKININV